MEADPHSPRTPSRLGHARSLDGIRGVAVLVVLGHNLGFSGLRGGFFGVDVFFALSGFLITTLLFEDFVRHGAISLANFFRRRFFRLYPALVVLVLASAFSSITRPNVELERVGWVAASALLYFSNWLIAADSDAWVGGLAHTWSLAVEVHFYLGWALVLTLVTRRWGLALKPLLVFALGVAAASAAWRIVVWTSSDNLARVYGGTDTRLDAVFLGVAAALFRWRHLSVQGGGAWPELSRGGVRLLEILVVLGLAGLIGWTPDKAPLAFLGGFGVVGAATAFLILTTLLSPDSLLARPLQSRVLGWFGEISYSLYLWHLPVKKIITSDRFARLGLSEGSVDALGVLLSIALAAASYYGVERAFQRWRQKARE
jgi:peptidoglycan/LPS O-acetylase OafA/YrhL